MTSGRAISMLDGVGGRRTALTRVLSLSTELGLEGVIQIASFHPDYRFAGTAADDITNAIVADRLREPDAKRGFLLDGYPRTPDQVAELDRVLAAEYEPLNAVVLIDADPEEVVARLLKRAADQGRADDTEGVIRHRMSVYSAQTAPLIDLYQQRGILVTVNGLGSVDEVTERILSALAGAGVVA
jgi:adenylate kinase